MTRELPWLKENEEFVTPFELRVGDRIKCFKPGVPVATVTEACAHGPRYSIGQAILDRNGRDEYGRGDCYRLMFDHGSGISGTWDGETGFVRFF